MAFQDLSGMQREAIEERWLELRECTAAAAGFEAACEAAGAGTFSTAMTSAMLALHTDIRNGRSYAEASPAAEGYFDARCGEEPGSQAELAKRLADDLIADLASLQRSLRSARDALATRAGELELLADMADSAIDGVGR